MKPVKSHQQEERPDRFPSRKPQAASSGKGPGKAKEARAGPQQGKVITKHTSGSRGAGFPHLQRKGVSLLLPVERAGPHRAMPAVGVVPRCGGSRGHAAPDAVDRRTARDAADGTALGERPARTEALAAQHRTLRPLRSAPRDSGDPRTGSGRPRHGRAGWQPEPAPRRLTGLVCARAGLRARPGSRRCVGGSPGRPPARSRGGCGRCPRSGCCRPGLSPPGRGSAEPGFSGRAGTPARAADRAASLCLRAAAPLRPAAPGTGTALPGRLGHHRPPRAPRGSQHRQ